MVNKVYIQKKKNMIYYFFFFFVKGNQWYGLINCMVIQVLNLGCKICVQEINDRCKMFSGKCMILKEKKRKKLKKKRGGKKE